MLAATSCTLKVIGVFPDDRGRASPDPSTRGQGQQPPTGAPKRDKGTERLEQKLAGVDKQLETSKAELAEVEKRLEKQKKKINSIKRKISRFPEQRVQVIWKALQVDTSDIMSK